MIDQIELLKDKERLDWLESKSNGQHWIARQSSTGRGFRLHNTSRQSDDWHIPSPTVRQAIDAAMAFEMEQLP